MFDIRLPSWLQWEPNDVVQDGLDAPCALRYLGHTIVTVALYAVGSL